MEDLFKTLGINPKVLIVQIIAFGLLFWVLWRFLFKRIGQFLQSRETEIKGSYEKIEAKQAEVERLTADYKRRLDEIEAQRQARINEAVKEAQAVVARLKEQAEKDRQAELARVKDEIRIERDKAVLELRQEAAKMAVEIAERILSETVTPDVQKRVVERYLKELDSVKPV